MYDSSLLVELRCHLDSRALAVGLELASSSNFKFSVAGGLMKFRTKSCWSCCCFLKRSGEGVRCRLDDIRPRELFGVKSSKLSVVLYLSSSLDWSDIMLLFIKFNINVVRPIPDRQETR